MYKYYLRSIRINSKLPHPLIMDNVLELALPNKLKKLSNVKEISTSYLYLPHSIKKIKCCDGYDITDKFNVIRTIFESLPQPITEEINTHLW